MNFELKLKIGVLFPVHPLEELGCAPYLEYEFIGFLTGRFDYVQVTQFSELLVRWYDRVEVEHRWRGQETLA